MKYLKLFEELKPDTYQKAANVLDNLGHKKRASNLRDWSINAREKENFRKWSPFGPYKMDILKSNGTKTKEGWSYTYTKIMWGNFYLGLSIDEENRCNISDWYSGGSSLWINFYLGFMPADDDTTDTIDNIPENVMANKWGGMTWDNLISIEFTKSGSKEILKYPNIYIDIVDQYKMVCSDRKSAIKLRQFIIDVFQEKIILPDSGIRKIKELLLEVTGSNETFSKIQENIKNISVNSFFRD
jgi:hypothetical protein